MPRCVGGVADRWIFTQRSKATLPSDCCEDEGGREGGRAFRGIYCGLDCMYVLLALSFFVVAAEPQWDQLVTIGCRTDSLKSVLVVTSSILLQLGLVGNGGEFLRREIAMEAIIITYSTSYPLALPCLISFRTARRLRRVIESKRKEPIGRYYKKAFSRLVPSSIIVAIFHSPCLISQTSCFCHRNQDT